MARICLAIATAFGVKKGSRAPTVADYLPKVERVRRQKPRVLTVEQSAAVIRSALGVVRHGA